MIFVKKNRLHLIFLFIIFLYYLLPKIFFGGFLFHTTTDFLDSEILYNYVLGNIYKGDFYILNSLINSQYYWYYFTRIFHFTNFFYSFLELEYAFLFIDILVKSFAYISFYKLATFLKKNEFFSFLISVAFSFAVTSTTENYQSSIYGFGISALPYLTYLVLKKKKLSKKNYLLIILTGITSHFYLLICMPFFFIFLFCYNTEIKKKILIKVITIFSICCFVVNSNLFYISFFSKVEFNRSFWILSELSLKDNLYTLLRNLTFWPLYFVTDNSFEQKLDLIYLTNFFVYFPLFIINLIGIYSILFFNIKKKKIFYFFIIFILLIVFLEKTKIYSDFLNSMNLGITKTIQFNRLKIFLVFLFYFLIINYEEKKIKSFFTSGYNNITIFFLIISISFFLLHNLIVPLVKKTINYDNLSNDLKYQIKNNFINFKVKETLKLLINAENKFNAKFDDYITINKYYDYDNFRFIKNIVKDHYVLPVDIDPSKLIINNIKSLGGYFQFYPNSYKVDFFEIIKNELDEKQKKDFIDEGHRLYASVSQQEKVKLNFDKAKLMGAKYVLSKKKLIDSRLEEVCVFCNSREDLHLYNIK
jgi:hypothetical protein